MAPTIILDEEFLFMYHHISHSIHCIKRKMHIAYKQILLPYSAELHEFKSFPFNLMAIWGQSALRFWLFLYMIVSIVTKQFCPSI